MMQPNFRLYKYTGHKKLIFPSVAASVLLYLKHMHAFKTFLKASISYYKMYRIGIDYYSVFSKDITFSPKDKISLKNIMVSKILYLLLTRKYTIFLIFYFRIYKYTINNLYYYPGHLYWSLSQVLIRLVMMGINFSCATISF